MIKTELHGFYKITNIITNKSYIGRSKYRCDYRLKMHINSMKNSRSSFFTPLYVSMRFFGEENFIVEPISKVIIATRPQEANEVELSLIKEYNTLYPNGYNVSGLEGESLKFYEKQKKEFQETMNISNYMFFENDEIIKYWSENKWQKMCNG